MYWSEYDPNAKVARNYAWQSHFVPRCVLFDGGAYEMHFPVVLGGTIKNVTSKTLTIKNGKITGHATNAKTVTINGATVNTGCWVLRSIIAV